MKRRATIALLMVAMIWGTTFVITPIICGGMDRLRLERLTAEQTAESTRPATPAELQAIPELPHRFLASADYTALLYCLMRFGFVALLMALWPRVWRRMTRRALIYGFWLGVLNAVGFLAQTAGLQRTTPAVSAFLTALYVPFTPLLVWLIWRRKLRMSLMVAIVMAFGGVTLMALGGQAAPADESAAATATAGIPFLGEMLTVVCALAFAGQIVLIDWTTKREGVVPLTFVMMVVTALLSLAPLPLFATTDALLTTDLVSALMSDADVIGWMSFISLLPTMVLFLVMLHYQRHVDASKAGLIYATEPIFATVYSVALGRDELIASKLIGGALIVFGNLIAETRPPDEKGSAKADPAPVRPLPHDAPDGGPPDAGARS